MLCPCRFPFVCGLLPWTWSQNLCLQPLRKQSICESEVRVCSTVNLTMCVCVCFWHMAFGLISLIFELFCASVAVAPSMPRKLTVLTAVTPTLVFGGTTWFSAAAPPPLPPPCVPHPPPLAPSAVPHLRRWRPRRTAAIVMTPRSAAPAQITLYAHKFTQS